MIDYFLSYQLDEVQKLNSEKENALHFCIRSNYLYGVEEILKSSSVNVDSSNIYGDTPLLIAITNDSREILDILLRFSPSIDYQRENDKETPLMVAAAHGRVEMIKILLSAGANKTLKNNNNFTAKELAENEGHWDIVKILS